MSEVAWEIGYDDGCLLVGFWVILAPLLTEFTITRDVFGSKVTPEEVGWVGVGG